ncbi:VapA/VapB family virulence-associated protein [Xenorhabdus lircayensis]|uniref:VapA/VapB family virulence-associated protein n=1 Tax=Xenorhabdus lircayensis TaxID=2763499 RepID=A0ABS0U4Z4_9GAMM|nr:VapA/VapB family virulence-associated protein [Xenorhabdus lircayensis]MBI6548959.1 VapA/VapB family virulence-associated protein [Xenorhabdus lircayensis]
MNNKINENKNENEIRAQALQHFSADMKGKLEQSKIDEICKEVILGERNYLDNGYLSITSYIFYTSLELTLSSNFFFQGQGNSLGTPGVGSYWGKLYARDFNKLRANKDSFWCNSSPAIVTVLFFDKNNKILGFFAGAGISTVVSGTSGTGSWSDIQ